MNGLGVSDDIVHCPKPVFLELKLRNESKGKSEKVLEAMTQGPVLVVSTSEKEYLIIQNEWELL